MIVNLLRLLQIALMTLQTNQKNMNELVLTKDKAIILVQALNEICNGPDAIDDFEFHSRMGATKDEVFKLLAEIQEYVKLSR
jgi:hypothetical protein